MNKLKPLLIALRPVLRWLFPKSRWGNIAYLVIGYILADWDRVAELLDQIKALF